MNKSDKETDKIENVNEEIKESGVEPEKEETKNTKSHDSAAKANNIAKELKNENARLKKEAEEMKASYDELNEKYTRMIAEYDNYRKRAAKEREGVYSDACADVLNEILPIKDNLELAVKYADAEKFSEGVVMTLNKFSDALEKMGVSQIGETGEKFNPDIHNAVMHIEDDSYEENIVAEVLLKGYKKGEKVIRYAMVKVAN